MTSFFAPLLPEYTLQVPTEPVVLVVWVVWFVALLLLTFRFRKWGLNFTRRSLVWLAVLSVLMLVVTPFFGFSIRSNSQQVFHLMTFSAAPWMAAAGMLGMTPAVLLAGVSGTLLAYLDTHHIFTPLLLMTAALIFTLSVRQRFRAWGFRLLRFPLVAALFTAAVLTPLILLTLTVTQAGDWAARLLTALALFPEAWLSVAGAIGIGGGVCVMVQAMGDAHWGGQGALRPAPGERDLRVRYAVISLMVMLIVLSAVTASVWQKSLEKARRSAIREMIGTVEAITTGGAIDITAFDPPQPGEGVTQAADLEQMGGSVQIIDGAGRLLYASESEGMPARFDVPAFQTSTFYETRDGTGFASVNYYQPVRGADLAVVATVPGIVMQRMALEAAQPVFLSGLVLILLATLSALLFLSRLRNQVLQLSNVAAGVSRGSYAARSEERFAGELAPLAANFQTMTATLRAQIQKQSDLLAVSERLTGQLDLRDSLQVILMAALARGASSARIVLATDSAQGLSLDQQFGIGQDAHRLAEWDQDVLAVTQMRGQWLLTGADIRRQFHGLSAALALTVVTGFPLRWKSRWLGTLWLAYRDRTALSEEELSYFNELAQKTATAITNVRAFDDSLTMRKRLESVLARLPDPVIITDGEGRVVYLNEPAARLPGLEERLGAPLVAQLESEPLRGLFTSPTSGSTPMEIELADGRSFEALISPLEIDGRPMGRVTVLRDITVYRQREALKTEFVTTVSHELRSPLTLVNGYAKILHLTGNLNPQQETYLENIMEGVQEMRALVQDLLDLGRLDSGDLLAIQDVNVVDVVQKAGESMRAYARQKQVEIALELPEKALWAEADPTFLTQALKNLVDNAIRFSDREKTVWLRLHQQAEVVVFTVEDQGPGIAPLDQRKIFKRFYRPETATEPEQSHGSGLGLAIVKSIAERHGGRVWFDSALGRGSSFYLEIPLRQAQ